MLVTKKRAGLLVLIALALLLFNLSCQRDREAGVKSKTSARAKPKTKPYYICPLDGVKVESETKWRPVGVMVENLNSVRPQSGLDQACVVFEALAEGGITRFLAVFGHRESQEVGPVRSARTYYVALAKGLNALYAHCGGSTTAMAAIKKWEVTDLDQFRYAQAYWRMKGIPAPHNLYTSISGLREVAQKADFEIEGNPTGWPHKKDKPQSERPLGQEITIDFSSPAYRVDYSYDRNSNTYLRKNGGKPHTDRITGKQLTAKNIVVLFVPTSFAPEGSGLLDIDIVGDGKSLIFQDGEVEQGNWQKYTADSPLEFLTEDGEEIKLNKGQTWVEIVKIDTPVTYHTVVEEGEES